MSGGSFEYLYMQNPYKTYCLEDMADELHKRGMYEAEAETRALISPRASAELAELWRAIEWYVSCDWGWDQVVEVYAKYEHRPKQ